MKRQLLQITKYDSDGKCFGKTNQLSQIILQSNQLNTIVCVKGTNKNLKKRLNIGSKFLVFFILLYLTFISYIHKISLKIPNS